MFFGLKRLWLEKRGRRIQRQEERSARREEYAREINRLIEFSRLYDDLMERYGPKFPLRQVRWIDEMRAQCCDAHSLDLFIGALDDHGIEFEGFDLAIFIAVAKASGETRQLWRDTEPEGCSNQLIERILMPTGREREYRLIWVGGDPREKENANNGDRKALPWRQLLAPFIFLSRRMQAWSDLERKFWQECEERLRQYVYRSHFRKEMMKMRDLLVERYSICLSSKSLRMINRLRRKRSAAYGMYLLISNLRDKKVAIEKFDVLIIMALAKISGAPIPHHVHEDLFALVAPGEKRRAHDEYAF